MMKDFSFISKNGKEIKGAKWICSGEDSANIIVYISHGMAEHIERYDDFANFLVSKGVSVYGHSHIGHGKTAGSVDKLGQLEKDGWNQMRIDLHTGIGIVRNENPDSEIVLLGHSMGSFLVRDYIANYSDVRRVVLSGTGFVPRISIKISKGIADLICRFGNPDGPSTILNQMFLGSYNRKIKNPATKFDWLSRDEKEVYKYINDEYCGKIHSARFFSEFLSGLENIHYNYDKDQLNVLLKMYIVSGSLDPVGGYSKNVKKVKKYYDEVLENIDIKLYDKARHEILNEMNKEEVYNDVINWIRK